MQPSWKGAVWTWISYDLDLKIRCACDNQTLSNFSFPNMLRVIPWNIIMTRHKRKNKNQIKRCGDGSSILDTAPLDNLDRFVSWRRDFNYQSRLDKELKKHFTRQPIFRYNRCSWFLPRQHSISNCLNRHIRGVP